MEILEHKGDERSTRVHVNLRLNALESLFIETGLATVPYCVFPLSVIVIVNGGALDDVIEVRIVNAGAVSLDHSRKLPVGNRRCLHLARGSQVFLNSSALLGAFRFVTMQLAVPSSRRQARVKDGKSYSRGSDFGDCRLIAVIRDSRRQEAENHVGRFAQGALDSASLPTLPTACLEIQ